MLPEQFPATVKLVAVKQVQVAAAAAAAAATAPVELLGAAMAPPDEIVPALAELKAMRSTIETAPLTTRPCMLHCTLPGKVRRLVPTAMQAARCPLES